MASGDFLTSLPGANDSDKFHELCKLPYKHQGVWYLNAFWLEGGEQEAETLWDFVERCGKIDNAKNDGFALDEMEAHRFLEQIHDAHTVLEMRSKLRSTGAIAANERPKNVPLTHYLLFKYNTDWHRLVNASQGDNSSEIAEAQSKLKAVQTAFDAADARARESQAAADESKARADEAKSRADAARSTEEEALAREAEAKEAEAPFKAACEELEAARADVSSQEEARNKKTEELKAAAESGGVVQRNKAKVQLDAHLAEDPLPLRKAKLTLEAAQKKADKARAPFQQKREAAEGARQLAEEARIAAEGAKRDAEAAAAAADAAKDAALAAVDDAARAMEEAEAYLNEVKSKPGAAYGAMWWIDRELHEKKKFMPTARGGIRK